MLHTITHNNLTWIDIRDPKQQDIKHLRKNFNFHELVLGELIPPGHRPKVEHHDEYLFLMLYYPVLKKDKHGATPRELDILVTKTHIITSHYETILPLKALFDQINIYDKAKEEYMSETTGHLLFYIMQSIFESALTKLIYIKEEVDEIEENIFSGMEKEMVFKISQTKRDIVDFRRVFAPQATIIESLTHEGINFFGKELEPNFEDIRGTFGIIWNEIQNHMETIQVLAETNESLLSTKINEIIRVLTVFSVVFLPLTLIASIWGMNIENMPLTSGVVGFWILVGVMGGLLILMLAYFRKKTWL